MKTLMKIFPLSFKFKKDIGDLIVNILVHLCIGALATMLVAIPVIGQFIGILSGIANLYLAVGIVLSVLNYFKVI